LSPDGKYVNAFLFAIPAKEVILRQIKPTEDSAIKMYGMNSDFNWKWDEKTGLTVEIPDSLSLPCKYVWVLKIEGAEI
jgi:hypothetical protein